MLIRSQDKKALFNLNTIDEVRLYVDKSEDNPIYEVLIDIYISGRFSDEAQALKVLDEIEEMYAGFLCKTGSDRDAYAVYHVPDNKEG